MKYIVEIKKEHSDKINKFISGKQYESVAQFVSVAIENQLYLENADLGSKLKPLKVDTVLKKSNFNKKVSEPEEGIINIPIKNINPIVVEDPRIDNIISVPNNCELEDCWLWGQINRIFPIKLGLRILLSKLENNEWIDLEIFRDEAAVIASKYREIIENTVKYKDINIREIAAGLPLYHKEGIDSLKVENSMKRYKNQFLAYVRTTDEKLDGALNQLHFINIKKVTEEDEKFLIGITNQGLKFAQLLNPIIDKQELNLTLSNEEKEFYINHIKAKHIGEYKATIWLLNKLKAGIYSREKINDELKKDYNKKWGFKDQVVNTQRAGLMARMTELGLIDKKKKGVVVQYFISNYGQEILKNNWVKE